jgi:hypothetical protein
MSGREILHRGASAITQVRERVSPPDGPSVDAGREGAARHPNAPRLVDDETVEFVRTLPGIMEAARVRAEPLASGQVAFFGDPPLEIGTRPDWHLDPATESHWPVAHWSRIDHREAGRDPKWIWELGRHQHLVHLARAWRLTGETKYAAAACDGIDSFVLQNPAGRGIHWRVGLELGLRLVSWSWTLAFLEGYEGLTADLHGRILESAASHLQQLERHPSLYSSANNHRLGELMGLVVGGLCFPEVHEASRYVDAGIDGLATELERQVHADGVNAEQATGYQCFVLDMVLAAAIALSRSGQRVPPSISQPTVALGTFLGRLVSDGGTLPNIGDQDDALGFDLASELTCAERIWSRLRTVELLFDVELERRESGLDEQTAWIIGPAAAKARDATTSRPSSSLSPDGGYAILRDRSVGELRAVLRAGPFGLGPLYAHAHADQLSLCVSHRGEEAIVDGGTFTYYGDARWRDYGRSTAAHSTLRVDQREQATPAGRFMWRTHAEGHITGMRVDDDTVEAVAHHDAYAPVRHERRVIMREGSLQVVDTLSGSPRRHAVELRWHFAPGELRLDEDEWVWIGEHARLIVGLEGVDSIRRAYDEEHPPAGVISRGLEQREPAPCLIATAHRELPVMINTTITPL